MKVGDIVRQHGNFVKGNLKTNTKTLGIVLEIQEFPEHFKSTHNCDLIKSLGRGITVIWANGKITANFAESALEVVSEAELERTELELLNTASKEDRIEKELRPIDESIVGQEDEYDEEIELYKTYGGD